MKKFYPYIFISLASLTLILCAQAPKFPRNPYMPEDWRGRSSYYPIDAYPDTGLFGWSEAGVSDPI